MSYKIIFFTENVQLTLLADIKSDNTGILAGIVYRLDSAQCADICATFFIMFNHHHHLATKVWDLKLKTENKLDS